MLGNSQRCSHRTYGSKLIADSPGWEGHAQTNCLPCAPDANNSNSDCLIVLRCGGRSAARRRGRPLRWRTFRRWTLIQQSRGHRARRWAPHGRASFRLVALRFQNPSLARGWSTRYDQCSECIASPADETSEWHNSGRCRAIGIHSANSAETCLAFIPTPLC